MGEFMGSLILGLLVFGLIAVLVFLITRAFWCWYWKISARLEEPKKTNLYLEAIYKLLAQGNAISAVTAELPEVCAETSEAAKAGYANICEIGKERIRRAGRELKLALQEDGTGIRNMIEYQRRHGTLEGWSYAEWLESPDIIEAKEKMAAALDTGFRVFKLDSSNLKTWDAAPIDPLDFPVTEVSVNGKTAYSVGEDCLLLVCLAPDIQPEDVEQMAEYAPAKAVISRDGFADDTAMANAYYILRDRGVELKLV